MINRRAFLAGILATGLAPAVVKASSLMRVKPILLPGVDFEVNLYLGTYAASSQIGRIVFKNHSPRVIDMMATGDDCSRFFRVGESVIVADGKIIASTKFKEKHDQP